MYRNGAIHNYRGYTQLQRLSTAVDSWFHLATVNTKLTQSLGSIIHRSLANTVPSLILPLTAVKLNSIQFDDPLISWLRHSLWQLKP